MTMMARRASMALVAVALAVPLIAARADAFVYWSLYPGAGGGQIGRANNDGSSPNRTFLHGLFGTEALAVDGSYIYWANGPNSIARANLDGTGVNPSFVSGIFSANAIAVDSVNGFIFWADLDGSRIGRANLATGSGVSTSFISTFGGKATGVAVDSTSKVVYWTTNANAGNGMIGRANEDGSGVQPTWIHGQFGAQGLTIDSTYLYWANGPDQIGRVNLDGTGLNATFSVGPRIGTTSGSSVSTPVPMAAGGGYLYWGNLYDGYIGRVSSGGGTAGLNNTSSAFWAAPRDSPWTASRAPGRSRPRRCRRPTCSGPTSNGSGFRTASNAACWPSSTRWRAPSTRATRRRPATVSAPTSTRCRP